MRTRLLSTLPLIAFIFCFGINRSIATHTAGLEIFYRQTQDSTYEFTLIYYRNCQGLTAGAPTIVGVRATAPSINRPPTAFNCPVLPLFGPGVPPINPPNLLNCTDASALCYEEYVYRGTWTSPQRAVDWKFTYDLCCRPVTNAPTNMQNGTQWIEAGLNNLDFPDWKHKNWSPFWHNRRPNHPGYPTDTVINYMYRSLCTGKYYSLDMSCREYQGDSVGYSFYWPQTNGGAPNPYINGWSFSYPLPTLPPGGPVINPITGIISITPGHPTGTGIYVLGIQAEEYRNDTIVVGTSTIVQAKRIGYVRRELTIWIDAPSSCRKDSVHIKNQTLTGIAKDSTVEVRFHNGIPFDPNSLVRCNTLSSDGSEFRVIDSSNYVAPYDSTIRNIAVISANWSCKYGGLTDKIILKLSEPLSCGNYSIFLKTGTDLDVIESECGYWEPEGSSGEVFTDNVVSVDLGPDTTVCLNKPFSFTIDAGKTYADYYWSTWDTTRSIMVTFPGLYWLTVSNKFTCKASDTMQVFTFNCDTTVVDTTWKGIATADQWKFHIYPNPSSGTLFIQSSQLQGDEEVILYDSKGAIVFRESLMGSNDGSFIQLNHLKNGIYFLKLTRNGEVLLQEKLILTEH